MFTNQVMQKVLKPSGLASQALDSQRGRTVARMAHPVTAKRAVPRTENSAANPEQTQALIATWPSRLPAIPNRADDVTDAPQAT